MTSTFYSFSGARSERNFIHVNLAVAIGLAQVTFLAGIDETGYKVTWHKITLGEVGQMGGSERRIG